MRNKEIFISNLIIVTRYAIYRNSSFLIRLESALFPTPFQFRSFRSFSPFFRIRPNRGKHLEKDILFYQFPAKADPSVRFSLPPPFVFLPPNHAIRIETITIPFPVHISSISFTNFPPFPLLLPRQESGGICFLCADRVCPTCHRPKLLPFLDFLPEGRCSFSLRFVLFQFSFFLFLRIFRYPCSSRMEGKGRKKR